MTKSLFDTFGEFLEVFHDSLRYYWDENIKGVGFDDWINETPIEELFQIVIEDSDDGIYQIFER